tara:strand:- start:59 stop:493 length:435 start_codon:yes stop_codon:yes gene_type:complete
VIDTWNPWWSKSKVEKRFEKSSVVGPSDNRTYVLKKKKVNVGPILKELKVKCKKYKLEEYFKEAKKKTVKELKAECKKHELAISGTKYILIKRLLKFERELSEEYFKEAKKKKDKFKNMTPVQREWQDSHSAKTSSKQNKDFIL